MVRDQYAIELQAQKVKKKRNLKETIFTLDMDLEWYNLFIQA